MLLSRYNEFPDYEYVRLPEARIGGEESDREYSADVVQYTPRTAVECVRFFIPTIYRVSPPLTSRREKASACYLTNRYEYHFVTI